jgi:hypothetical protein
MASSSIHFASSSVTGVLLLCCTLFTAYSLPGAAIIDSAEPLAYAEKDDYFEF